MNASLTHIDKAVRKLFIVSVVVIILSIIVGFYLNSTLHVFLAWNIFLAIIPLLLSYWIYQKSEISKKWLIILVSIIWLLFFPNSVYILTDFIHLGGVKFYNNGDLYSPSIYLRDIKVWVKFAHIIICAFTGLISGMLSLYLIESSLEKSVFKKHSITIIIMIILLAGLGVYIGRFLRFNSWDILSLPSLFIMFFKGFDWFLIKFIFLYSLVIMFFYYVFHMIINIKSSV
jgi:uncharacterized membrane protein